MSRLFVTTELISQKLPKVSFLADLFCQVQVVRVFMVILGYFKHFNFYIGFKMLYSFVVSVLAYHIGSIGLSSTIRSSVIVHCNCCFVKQRLVPQVQAQFECYCIMILGYSRVFCKNYVVEIMQVLSSTVFVRNVQPG